MRRLGLLLSLGLVLPACATFRPERGHTEVADLVRTRAGQETGWQKGPPAEAQVAERVGKLLAGGLTHDGAVAIALINSRTLRQTYEELGVGQAEMLDAGLLENPRLSVDLGFPLNPGGMPEIDLNIAQNFLNLFLLPARKRIAAEQFAAEVQRVAHETLGVAAEVSRTFVAVQAGEQSFALRRTVLEAARAQVELVRKQFQAGNVAELSLATEEAAYQQARLDLTRSELELLEQREHLNRLLGLWGPQTSWKLSQTLPELPPATEPALEGLEARAVRDRLDLAAARGQAQVMARAASLAKSTRFLGELNVGVDYHRDPDGPRVVGPTLELELPIFNQRGPLIARLEAQARQAEARLAGLGVDARSEVRLAHARLVQARAVAEHYRTTLLPLRERIVALSQQHYNGMFIGPAELLRSRQEQIESSQGYLEALRDYWQARAELERALGARVTPAAAPRVEEAR